MAYILSPVVTVNISGKWGEDFAYRKKSLYQITEGKLPPINYDEHTLRSHSLTHMEFPSHTQKEGRRLESYLNNNFSHFWGECLVLKIKNPNYVKLNETIFVHEITKSEIEKEIESLCSKSGVPKKILITTENYPENDEGFHDPNYVLILSLEAASYLVDELDIEVYGTSWKSSDFKPGSSDRPIHNKLFEKAVILELLTLNKVPQGIYFLVATPILIEGASESAVTPILFRYDEIAR